MKITNFLLTLAFFLAFSLFNNSILFSQDIETSFNKNCLCDQLEEGSASFEFENGSIVIDGHSIEIIAEGRSRTYTFDFHLAEALCSVSQGQVISEYIETHGIIEVDDQSLDFLSIQDISITLNNDYLRPRMFISFQRQEESDNELTEVSVMLSIDPETCDFNLQAELNGEMIEEGEQSTDLAELAGSFSHFTFEDMDQGTWALAVGILSDLINYSEGDAQTDDWESIKRDFLNAIKHFAEAEIKEGAKDEYAEVLEALIAAIGADNLDAVAFALAGIVMHV